MFSRPEVERAGVGLARAFQRALPRLRQSLSAHAAILFPAEPTTPRESERTRAHTCASAHLRAAPPHAAAYMGAQERHLPSPRGRATRVGLLN